MYATRKSTTGTYTSNGKIELSNKRIEYVTDSRDYSKVIMFVIIPLVLVGMYFFLSSIA